ncbi:unnamed protein product [Somion occarium]|uniref:Peptidase M20 dimerisation domain-containing protein n=1 Tax=Somion occarium TaxID=3059160 RepID=A0ABP1E4H0_9APHY
MGKGELDPAMGCFRRLLGVGFGRRHSRTQSLSRTPPMSDHSTVASSLTTLEKNEQAPPYYATHACTFCGRNRSSSEDTLPIQSKRQRVTVPPYSTRASSVNAENFHDFLGQDILKTIEARIDSLSPELRELSLDIWEHPEVAYEERHAHDVLTKFMSSQGFTVTPHYLGLETAWKAIYSRGGKNGRVIGINSEMDALPGIGHACGHNLIAVSGVAVAVALKAAMETHDISGTIILLGTPAEEHGGGKIKLLERGAYKEMNVCIMSHPSPGPANTALVAPWLALQPLEVEFFGHGAHAAYSPWEAQNALDAAFLAYSNVSVLRQQLKPTYRVHGIVSGKDWEPNIIPDYAKMRWIIRAPTWAELEGLRARITNCFEAAALATSCKCKIILGDGYYDVRENDVLGEEFCKFIEEQFGMNADSSSQTIPASTDFGNVTYALPCITPTYNIPTKPNGSNHTPQFAESAKDPAAHKVAMTASKGLAATALRVLQDEEFYQRVVKSFEGERA